MTASAPPATLPPPRRAWAAEQLGLAVDSSADLSAVAARRQFQRMLVDAQFVPPDAWRAAFDEATGREPAGAAPEAFVADRELQIRAELETFAEQLFQWKPAERQAGYDVLRRRCADFPRLVMRLRGLAPCLSVDLNWLPNDAPLLRQLGVQVARLAVLKPLDRAVARQAMIRDSVVKIQSVEVAARTLKTTRPEIASLAPDLIDELIHYRQTRQKLVAARSKPLIKQAKAAAKPQPANSGKQRGGMWWGYLIVFVVLGLVRALGGFDSSNHSPSPYKPSYSPPSYPIPDARPQLRPGASTDSPKAPKPLPTRHGTPLDANEEFRKIRERNPFPPAPNIPEQPHSSPAPPATPPRTPFSH